MGLFDGQIKKLGDTLSSKFEERASQVEKEWFTEEDMGRKLLLKITFVILREIALVVKNALNETE